MIFQGQGLAKRSTLLLLAACLYPVLLTGLAKSWKRHTIDSSDKAAGKLGADGVRLADVNGDGLLDITTGWEQGGAIVVYRNPGLARVRDAWPSVTVGRVVSPEDAVFVDLDNDGHLDVVSSCEGSARTMYIHWAPAKRADYWKPSAWKTDAIPSTKGKQSWMFAVPAQIDNEGGMEVFVSSKGGNGSIGFLTRTDTKSRTRDAGEFEFVKLRSAGWIMSLQPLDMDGDGSIDLLYSDRKGAKRGVGWLENPGNEKYRKPAMWKDHALGGQEKEVMFLDTGDLDGDGRLDIVCATRNQQILLFENTNTGWNVGLLPNPFGLPNGKAVAIGDVNGDRIQDIVHTTNTGGNRKVPGVSWLKQDGSNWMVHDIGGSAGVKFDLNELIDLDMDGDLDAVTCVVVDNLGLFWFENPLYDSSKLHRTTSD